MTPEEAAYHELCAYTLTLGDAAFLHQVVVDAWAAQRAGPVTKPIALCFALVGLHLHVDRGWTGRRVQRAHMTLARRPEPWPAFPLPEGRGTMTTPDVLAAPPGAARDTAISRWAASVWGAFAGSRATVEALLARHGIG